MNPQRTLDNQPTVMQLGASIAHYRNLKGLRQTELAQLTGLDASTISKLERGDTNNMSVANALKIAVALGVTLNHLVMPVDS